MGYFAVLYLFYFYNLLPRLLSLPLAEYSKGPRLIMQEYYFIIILSNKLETIPWTRWALCLSFLSFLQQSF